LWLLTWCHSFSEMCFQLEQVFSRLNRRNWNDVKIIKGVKMMSHEPNRFFELG
jgi:hypothetical protein